MCATYARASDGAADVDVRSRLHMLPGAVHRVLFEPRAREASAGSDVAGVRVCFPAAAVDQGGRRAAARHSAADPLALRPPRLCAYRGFLCAGPVRGAHRDRLTGAKEGAVDEAVHRGVRLLRLPRRVRGPTRFTSRRLHGRGCYGVRFC